MENRTNRAKQYYHSWKKERLNYSNEQEINFAQKMKNQFNYDFTGATQNENMYEHWDVKFSHSADNHQEIRYVDVKSANKKYPYFVIIELKNNYGKPGWIYKNEGKNHWLCFEFHNTYLIIPTANVREWVGKNINKDICIKGEISQTIYEQRITVSRNIETINDQICMMSYDDLIKNGGILIDKV